MLKNKFTRHTTAFLTVAATATLLYPVAQAGWVTITWLLLGLAATAALLTLATK